MAAYAALVSLLNNMDLILNHPHHSFSFHNKQIESLQENLNFLLNFMESSNYHGGIRIEAEDLESQIASAVHEAEDVIESHVVDQIRGGTTLNKERRSLFLVDLQRAIENIDLIKQIAMKVEVNGRSANVLTYSNLATSSRSPTDGKIATVGFHDELIRLMDVLTGQQSNRLIVSIVGMGGIGKTTLARNVYENLAIVEHFDIRAWATVSQDYNVKEILFELVSCHGKSSRNVNDDGFGEFLHKSLWGRRYLIVLDDMWSTEAWDEIKFFFPDNGNRSRIVVTSRQSNMANHLGSMCITMKFLDEDESWNLFCEKAFAREGCPSELEDIGKKIVKKCRGLPLAIVVIGGLLGRSSRMQEYWAHIAKDLYTILDCDEGEQCMNILLLSYSYLPCHLKPCFLYMGILQEDHAIYISHLVGLWVAEGFIKPNETRSLEEVAEDYLKDLIDRNLILVRQWSRIGKIKTCYIHDLIRELCLKVAKKEKFLYVLDSPQAMQMERRVVIHGAIPDEKHCPELFHALKSAPLVRSLICQTGKLSFDIRLLRILDQVRETVNDVDREGFLEANFEQFNLRYIMCHMDWIIYIDKGDVSYPPFYIPSSVSLVWNLQTLIISSHYHQVTIAPSEIWEMAQLRHLITDQICLPDPLPSDKSDQQNEFVLHNLQTLTGVENFRLTEEVCRRIPNIKKLHLQYNDFSMKSEASSYYCPHNLGRFHKLESLEFQFSVDSSCRDFVLNFKFPSSLKKLSLINCHIYWEDLTIIGSLPHLEVFKLGGRSDLGPEWNPIEGQFLRLKSLKIHYYCDLIDWNADSCHFPVLENLLLRRLSELNEIPLSIGEIPTLRFIRLKYCSLSAAVSAVKIMEEQQSQGNEELQLEVKFWYEWELRIFEDEVQLQSVTRKNVRLVVRC